MKRCPQCGREYDSSMMFCLDDGAELLYGPASMDEPATAILSDTSNEAKTAAQIQTTEQTAIQPPSISKMEGLDKRFALAAIALTLVVLGGFFGYRYFAANNKQINSIAVMPFVNDSGNAENEYLSDGMTEALIGSLSQIAGLNVKSRSSVFRYKGKETDAKTIGKELNVQAVLNGRVVQRGDQLTLTLELIDAQNENLLWSDKYDRRKADLVSLQSEIARDVSSKLKLKLTNADQLKLGKSYTSDPEVYRLYLQGRYYWNKRTFSEVAKGVPFFQEAIDKDPKFALGYIGLADSNEDQNRPQKLEYIRRALDIDPDLAEAHASLGYQLICKQDWAASDRELSRAKELNPNYAQAYAWNGMRLTMIGKYDEALAELDRALAIEPSSNGINFYKATTLAVSGRRDAAIQLFKRIQEIDPTFPWAYAQLGRQYFFNGDVPSAVEQWCRSVELEGDADGAVRLRDAFAAGGWKAFVAEARKSSRPRGFAAIEGPQDKASTERLIERLQQRAETGDFWLFQIRTEPTYDSLRDDPRFQEILKRFDPPQ
jgi:TolB-like protein